MSRARVVAGNWKMFKTAAQTREYLQQFLKAADDVPASVQLVLCPPFTSIPAASEMLDAQQRVALGAQNVHWGETGAFTGEISAPMLREFGVRYVIVGHSERRQFFGETDETVRWRTAAALQADLIPIVAVGESPAIREQGSQTDHVVAQIRAALDGLDRSQIERVIVAYEPIWAIGTGKNCDAAAANDIMGAIRTSVDGLQHVPILYGGSVKPENIAQYASQPEIDGGLVGGASLDPLGFARLAAAAA